MIPQKSNYLSTGRTKSVWAQSQTEGNVTHIHTHGFTRAYAHIHTQVCEPCVWAFCVKGVQWKVNLD